MATRRRTTETDLQLLQKYVASRDAEAFADIVRRHSPMVYGACLRVTGDPHSAEDAAQECFLALARRAGNVRSSLAGWLHRSAVNHAIDQIRDASSRRDRESAAIEMNSKRASGDEATWAEIAPYVDEALTRLSDDIREVLIRHFMEDKTQAVVAEELGIDQSSVSRRIERGLELLRATLRRKGVIATSAVLGTLLVSNSSQAAPAALTAALGKMAMAGVSAGAKSAAAGTGAAMLKASVAALAITAAITVAIAVSPGQKAPQPAAPPAVAPAKVAPPPATPAKATVRFSARVLSEETGSPVSGASVIYVITHDRDLFQPASYETAANTRTDEAGRFSVDADAPESTLLSFAGDIVVDHPDYALGWYQGMQLRQHGTAGIVLRRPRNVAGMVVDMAGKPIAGATVTVDVQIQSDEGGYYHFQGRVFPQVLTTHSDTTGHFIFSRIPEDAKVRLSPSHPDYCTQNDMRSLAEFPNRAGDEDIMLEMESASKIAGRLMHEGQPVKVKDACIISLGQDRMASITKTDEEGRYLITSVGNGPRTIALMEHVDEDLIGFGKNLLVDKTGVTIDQDMELFHGRTVNGRVVSERNGKPLKGQWVEAYGTSADTVSGHSVSDEDGRFSLVVSNGDYKLQCRSWMDPHQQTPRTQDLAIKANAPVPEVELKIAERPQVIGKLEMDGKPIQGKVEIEGQAIETDEAGHFAIDRPFDGSPLGGCNISACSLDRKAGATSFLSYDEMKNEVTLEMLPTATITGSVVDENGTPVPDASLEVLAFVGWSGETLQSLDVDGKIDKDGRFEVGPVNLGLPLATLNIKHRGSFADVKLNSVQPGEIFDVGTIVLKPFGKKLEPLTAKITGRVLDPYGNPIKGQQVYALGMRNGSQDETDSKGRFVLRRLPVNARVEINVNLDGYQQVRLKNIATGTLDLDIRLSVQESGLIDSPAPNMQISQWLTEPVSLQQLRGKVVLLDVGVNVATYDDYVEPILEMQKKYGDKGLAIIVVHESLMNLRNPGNKAEMEVRSYFEKRNFGFAVGLDKNKQPTTKDMYEVVTSPTAFLIDKKGIVRAAPARDKLDEWIAKLIAE